MSVEVEGLQELQANLNNVASEIAGATMKGLEAVGLEVVAEAKKNLKRNRTNNTMTLSASGRVQKVKEKGEEGIDAGFFSSGSDEGYAAAVEYGRGPSQRRSAISLEQSLKAWVHRKLGVPYGKELNSAAFLIARKIHRRGTKAQPFFAPAVKKVQAKLEEIISKYVDNKIKETTE